MANTNSNPVLGWPLRLFMGIVALVLIIGLMLFFFPSLISHRWPWKLTPFNTRFLGAIYLSEMTVVAVMLVVNRWAPARIALPIALTFTGLVSVASFFSLDSFLWQRRGSWIWFVLYLDSVLISAAFVWVYRHLPQPTLALPPAGFKQKALQLEAVALGIYGLGLLLAPTLFSAFWPWKIDSFHGQLYSAIFIGGAIGVYLLSRAAAPIELFTMGLAELVFGFFAIAGLIIVDMAVDKVKWDAPGTWLWLGLFVLILVVGLHKIWQSRAEKTAAASKPITPGATIN